MAEPQSTVRDDEMQEQLRPLGWDRWRGQIEARLANLEHDQQTSVNALVDLRAYVVASLERLHEDVCRNLTTLQQQLAVLTEKMAQREGVSKALQALLPLAYAVASGVMVFWLTKK